MADKEEKPADKFYAVVLTDDGEFCVEEFETLEQLTVRLKNLIDRDVSVFSFMGTRLHVSKPPFRHLMTPQGNIPLFDVKADGLEPDATGYLGVDPIYFESPPQVKMPASKPAADDEFFDDGDDTGTGIFDNILPDPDS